MREFKFRIFTNGKMIYPEDNYWIHISMKGEICIPQCCNEDCEPEDNQEKYKLMQFTGLKDKNVEEIYEGDILRFIYKHLEEPEIYIGNVIFKDSCFIVKDICSRKNVELLIELGDGNNEYCEVIGNIYENPELLKENSNA